MKHLRLASTTELNLESKCADPAGKVRVRHALSLPRQIARFDC